MEAEAAADLTMEQEVLVDLVEVGMGQMLTILARAYQVLPGL